MRGIGEFAIHIDSHLEDLLEVALRRSTRVGDKRNASGRYACCWAWVMLERAAISAIIEERSTR